MVRKCNVKKLGKVFKEPEAVWDKMLTTYEQKRQKFQKEESKKSKDPLTQSLQSKLENENMGWTISREMMMDVYANPEKWGAFNFS